MRHAFRHALIFLVLSASGIVCNSQIGQLPRITSPVNDRVRKVIPSSTHPLARPAFEVGGVDAGLKLDRMILVLAPSAQQESLLAALLANQHDKMSPDYHRWLSPDEFGQRFGAAPQDIQSVKTWLTQQGFTVSKVARSGRWLEFSGDSGQIEHVFQTSMRQYSVAGQLHIANASDISIPAALAPVVRGIVSLHDFRKKPAVRGFTQLQRNTDGTFSKVNPNATSSTGLHALSAGDFATIYGSAPAISAGNDGTGVSIAVVARANIFVGDVASFRGAFGLPAANPIISFPNGGFPVFLDDDAVEATLDVEWSGAAAPGATINLVSAQSSATTDGVDLSSAFIVDNNMADIMTVSFGACEADLGATENSFLNGLWQQAAAEGISVVVSSGDSGAAGCDLPQQSTPATHGLAVSGVASTPFNTAVGGTQFNEGKNPALYWLAGNSATLTSVTGYIPEVVWNESCDASVLACPGQFFALAGTGGGSSALYPKPSWQSLSIPGVVNDGFRDIPDVSFAAASGHDPYLICFNGSCNNSQFGAVGGTSVSAPAFAGTLALVVQATRGRQGLANYPLYRIAASENFASCNSSARVNPSVPSACVFNDITVGNNSVPGLPGFSANAGFERATGLGSVNIANLVNTWKALVLRATSTTLSPAAITAVHGQPVTLTASVTGPSAPSPSGTVGFLTDRFGSVSTVGSLTQNAAGPVATFSGAVADLPGGTYNLSARYPGDGINAASLSLPASVTISPEPSAITLEAFAADPVTGVVLPSQSIPYASVVILNATVKGTSGKGTATGFVNFLDSAGEVLPTAALDQRSQAEIFIPSNLQPTALAPGTHTITANWLGDQSFAAGSSPTPLTFTIIKGNPVVTFLPFSAFTATQPTPVFVNVGPQIGGLFIVPTGTLQLFDGTNQIGSLTLAAGRSQATFQPVFTSSGNHVLTAQYSGDSVYNPATSAPQTINVFAAFGLAGSINATVAAGQTTNISLQADGTAPGPVTITCSGTPGITCAANPSSINLPGGTIVPVTVSITASPSARLSPSPLHRFPIILAGVFALGVGLKRKPTRSMVFVLFAGLLISTLSACGGGGSTSTPLPTVPRAPTSGTITLTSTSGPQSSTFTVTVKVTH